MAKNNKTRFFYVLYSDKTRVFDQSERAHYPIYITNIYIMYLLVRYIYIYIYLCNVREYIYIYLIYICNVREEYIYIYIYLEFR